MTKAPTLPEWVLSRRRIRVFQSSRGFYTTQAERKEKAAKTALTRRGGVSLGLRIERWRRTALLQTDENFEQVILGAPFADLLAEQVYRVAQEGRYLGNGHVTINDARDLYPWIKQTK